MAKIAILFGACFISYFVGYKIGTYDTFRFLKEKLEEHKNNSC